ncbi:MAG TPA: hypothetical protein VG122_03860 [Gemmata sp.]|nr:hypothetical protein [Gemmata sp.]
MKTKALTPLAKWSAFSSTALLAAVGFWTLKEAPRVSQPPVTLLQSREPEVHYVTPQQLTDSASLSATVVPALTATTDKDQVFTWPLPQDSRPLLLVFIKEGCPCSVELEPYFHRLQRTYKDVVRFAGVIDADVLTAQRYARTNATPYPILADRERRIIHRFRAENGAYVALVALPGSTIAGTSTSAQDEPLIDSLWPGCSAELFTQMGHRLAAASGVMERPLDVSGLPSAPITGCPFAP